MTATEPTSFADAAASAAARVDEALPPAAAPGDAPVAPVAPVAPAGEPETPIDFFSDEGLDSLVPEGALYRDVAKFRSEFAKTRDRLRPLNDAFGSLDEESRQALLAAAPELGGDLPTIASRMAGLHPQDRAWFVDALEVFASGDTVKGAEMLANAAAALRGTAAPGAPVAPVPEWAQGDSQVAPEDLPITRADLTAWQAEQRASAEQERLTASILADARELGYDPEAKEGTVERDDFDYLLLVAGRPAIQGDLTKAHEVVSGRRQAAIDEFVKAKSADAARPAAPADAGQAPAETRSVATMVDADAAMRERVAASMGPDPRRRGAE